jgi:hypothetical protein
VHDTQWLPTIRLSVETSEKDVKSHGNGQMNPDASFVTPGNLLAIVFSWSLVLYHCRICVFRLTSEHPLRLTVRAQVRAQEIFACTRNICVNRLFACAYNANYKNGTVPHRNPNILKHMKGVRRTLRVTFP